VLHNAHIDPAFCPIEWVEPTVVTVSPLLRALLIQLADPAFMGRTRRLAEELLFDLVARAETDELALVMPVDSRALEVAHALISDPADARTLDEWARTVATSGRTLARRFLEETGCSFTDWRSTVRLSAARALLASGRPSAVAARQVGYRDVDSFSLAYRRRYGHSPSRRG
jgi:transcriptional regulator GlxA family with amidase domain